ncbi:hypothetical protein [Fodinicola acaciae]|uniref:hypothetical protein n=1 Tax=Fodinicola acaciae TaxID=2681555 RepID=UPI001C9E71EC|nr:hypothetical protein [Fodinicola acaciae]
MRLLAAQRARLVTVGHGRDERSTATAEAFVAAWTDAGGTIAAVVDWPETAASWLRQARRFVRDAPDAWVVASGPTGFGQLARRLRAEPGWDPDRTYGFAALASHQLLDVAEGVRGATATGETWRIHRGWISIR